MAARHQGSAASVDTIVTSLWTAMQAARTRMANLAMRGAYGMDLESYHGRLDAAASEVQETEFALAAKSARFASELTRSRIGLEEVIAALPTGAAIVAYCRYETPWDPDDAPASRIPPCYVAFIARSPASGVVARGSGEGADIESAVTVWRSRALGKEALSRNGESADRFAAESLRQQIWDPVDRQLPELSGCSWCPTAC